jgi:NAD(P)-dependent dehydrogenase (short-subunit alcohol dehydrogenase family)
LSELTSERKLVEADLDESRHSAGAAGRYAPAMTTKQAPIHSGFGAKTTASEALGGRKLEGAIAIVTGGYAGIGLETTRVLAGAGATVIVPARTPEKARAALAGMARVELEALDLSEPATIDAYAARFLASGRPLHILVNNAGIMATPLIRDSRGFDIQFATNHLGHFQLTARLGPAWRTPNGARVVSLTSRGHVRAGVDFEDPKFEHRPYDKWVAYGQSKTANALFALALDARGEAHGVRAFSAHPGGIVTELMRSMPAEEVRAILAEPRNQDLKTVEQGAATSIWCATSTQLDGMGGVYCEDVDISEAMPADSTAPRGVRPWAMDKSFAERLWSKSEEWTGVKFGV